MLAEKVRALLDAGVECIRSNLVVGQEEHDQLEEEYEAALAELTELEGRDA